MALGRNTAHSLARQLGGKVEQRDGRYVIVKGDRVFTRAQDAELALMGQRPRHGAQLLGR